MVDRGEAGKILALLSRVLRALSAVCTDHSNLVLLVMHDPTLTACCNPTDDGAAAIFLRFLADFTLNNAAQVGECVIKCAMTLAYYAYAFSDNAMNI